jgi:hypothetical protein
VKHLAYPVRTDRHGGPFSSIFVKVRVKKPVGMFGILTFTITHVFQLFFQLQILFLDTKDFSAE